MRRIITSLIGLSLLLSAALVPVASFASVISNSLLGTNTETTKLLTNFEPGGFGKIKGPGEIVFNVVYIFLGILGIITVLLMIYGGFLWLTAGGEENKAKQGTTILFQAVVGLIIILSSYAVTYFVLVQITTAVTK